MSDRSEQTEPAQQPAPIPPMSEIEAERKREIGVQVRAAVNDVLTKGASVSAAQFRKWGPDGVGYFFRVLRSRIAAEMPEAPQAKPPVTPTAPEKAAEGRAQTERAPQRGKPKKPAPKGPPVSTKDDWTAQQRNRMSARMRAIMHGLIVAVVLFAGAAAFVRLWATLVPAILQQIQNWS